ncbi:MAG: hypothetical protein IPP72_01725 [Chitinophagaceae bacterium]|nr:hypothetical protein [Chitinophagaceae bacterium]
MRYLIFILLVSAVCFSCKKDTAGKPVEIYLLKTYQTVTGKCQVNASTALLKDTAMIANNDILAYSPTLYQFKLSERALQKAKDLDDFTPFAVCVDKEVIYYGIFKSNFSSSSCDNSITMDAGWGGANNHITMNLGYPGTTEATVIDDLRNDPVLITSLQQQGKLK